MGSKTTLIGVIYLSGAALVALVGDKLFTSIFLLANVSNNALLGENFTLSTLVAVLLAIGTAWYFYLPKYKLYVNETIDEVSKVSWPTWSETKTNTVVVIIFSFISAGILGVFDFVFSNLTSTLLAGGSFF
jgi:preprotein translocase subunit SecE